MRAPPLGNMPKQLKHGYRCALVTGRKAPRLPTFIRAVLLSEVHGQREVRIIHEWLARAAAGYLV